MKIVDISSLDSQTPLLAVVAAESVGPYTLRLTFNTAKHRTVDFGDFLRHAQHPAVRAYLDKHRFRQFSLVNGNVNWNDYDLIFPVADLYAGKVAWVFAFGVGMNVLYYVDAGYELAQQVA